MKKDDGISILLSIVINILVILLIPSLSLEKVVNKKIKVGLVAFENKNRTKLEGKKNTNSEKKNLQETKKKEVTPKKEVSPPKNEKENKKTEKKIDLSALNSIANNLSTPKIDVISSNKPNSSLREISKLEVPKKEFSQSGGVVSKNNLNSDINLTKELISAENEKLDLKDDDKISFNSEIGKDSSFDRILQVTGDVEGLPSGYRLGTEDGDIVARWDSSNREPVYPESAQLKGLHGSVKIRMSIDEAGNVKTLALEKGSGVPEINNAIEKVGRSWKIYLSKNGLSVQGEVILEYNFVLKGKVD